MALHSNYILHKKESVNLVSIGNPISTFGGIAPKTFNSQVM